MPPNKGLPDPFGHFRILRELGAGGMGTVYEAEDTRRNRRVALKVPQHSNAESVQRFYREARFAQSVHDPCICPVYEVGEIDGISYLTMPYLEGTPLDQLIGPAQLWEPSRAAELIRRLAFALETFHRRQTIHRDLKPHNIMLRANDEPMLMDFGLARDLSGDLSSLTSTGAALGTPWYMAPEQIEGDKDALSYATDVYGLGVVLYELLTGQRPFQASNHHALYNRILNTSPTPPTTLRPDLDPRIEAICLKMLAKRGQDRYATMGDLIEALTEYLHPTEVEVPVPGWWMARRKENPNAEWQERCKTPALVSLLPGEAYRLMVSPAVNDEALMGCLSRLRGITGLLKLDLAGCTDITDAGLVHLRGLTGLQELDLSGCKRIRDAGLAHLRGLTSLQRLDLSGCKRIRDTGLAHLRGLTGLQQLDLAFCEQVTDTGLASLRGLTGLQQLGLRFCLRITDAGLAHLRSLTGLQQLDLTLCEQVTDAGLVHLRGLTALQQLDLSGCKHITDAGLAHLRGLTTLRRLDLAWCYQITDAGLVHLRGLTGLQELDLTFCEQIAEAGLAALRRALPRCEIRQKHD